MRWESSLNLGQSNPSARAGAGDPDAGGDSSEIASVEGDWTCSADVQIEDLVEITSSGTVGRANPVANPDRSIIGFVIAKSDSLSCTVRYSGEITLSTVLVPSKSYYAINGGQISESGSSTGKSQPVGVGKTSSILIINITRPILL
jgi:hypothetical protein